MNTLIVTALLFNLSSYKMLIQDYQSVPELDYQTVLTVSNLNKRVLIDCQSFINAIYYQSFVDEVWQNDWSLMINGNQCDDVTEYAKISIDDGNPFCFSVDTKKRLIDVTKNVDECSDVIKDKAL